MYISNTKTRQIQQRNYEIEKQNQVTLAEYNKNKELLELIRIEYAKEQIKQSQERLKYLGEISSLRNQVALQKENIELETEKMRQSYLEEYHQVLNDSAEEYDRLFSQKHDELDEISTQLEILKSKEAAAIEANKRAQQIKEENLFYKLHLTELDVQEIKKLREVAPYLRDATPLNKVIWKVYYEHPYTDLVGRVIGKGTHTGIYKITNVDNGMCYVGQAKNLAARWKQHIMCGIGADVGANNKLYPAMLEYGVENFTFEVIEECQDTELNEREQYWQDYFEARTFGYSIK